MTAVTDVRNVALPFVDPAEHRHHDAPEYLGPHQPPGTEFTNWCSFCTPRQVPPGYPVHLIETEIPWFYVVPARWGMLTVCRECATSGAPYAELFNVARLGWQRVMTAMLDNAQAQHAHFTALLQAGQWTPELPQYMFPVYKYQQRRQMDLVHLAMTRAWISSDQLRTPREDARARGFEASIEARMAREDTFFQRFLDRLTPQARHQALTARYA